MLKSTTRSTISNKINNLFTKKCSVCVVLFFQKHYIRWYTTLLEHVKTLQKHYID